MSDVEVGRCALGSLPGGIFLMTSRFDTKRTGVLVRSVQRCAQEPPLVCVALVKGHSIEPLIRDSHCFALCAVDETDRLLMRRFIATRAPDLLGDPFDGLEVERLATGAPVLRRSSPVLDCEVFRHFDLEADHELYVGLVVAARCSADSSDLQRKGAGK